MTFSSFNIDVRCKTCKHRLMEVHEEGKIYGPYQVIARTSRSTYNEDGWLPDETVFYHHCVENDKGCNCFADRDELEENRLTFYNVLYKNFSEGFIQEKESITCRIIWHKVHGFSDNDLKKIWFSLL